MYENTRKFSTKNFTVVWREYEPKFVDPLALGQDVTEMVTEGRAMLTQMNAKVYFRDVEIGSACLADCIYIYADADNPYGHDRVIVEDRSYHSKVVRWATNDARQQLADIRSEWPDLYIRKTG
ncbi:hypothetical protein FZ983_33195 [Azospirillum sp. B21]|uniref:hypothetical protein n=1 Tax=Azospirillum sp. B21 TaxID=2607496 RepID=UPI0011F01F7B|nr:hypothetical protein [Azospirillum sp. B21]KAA0571565.1 hypothetical protein FZ983_33195 [Azospirillum sp. B21]